MRPTSSLMTWPPVSDRDVAQHLLAAVAEAGRLDGEHVDDAAQLVHDERRERLAIDVLGDDEEVLLARLERLLERRQHVLRSAEIFLSVMRM